MQIGLAPGSWWAGRRRVPRSRLACGGTPPIKLVSRASALGSRRDRSVLGPNAGGPRTERGIGARDRVSPPRGVISTKGRPQSAVSTCAAPLLGVIRARKGGYSENFLLHGVVSTACCFDCPRGLSKAPAAVRAVSSRLDSGGRGASVELPPHRGPQVRRLQGGRCDHGQLYGRAATSGPKRHLRLRHRYV